MRIDLVLLAEAKSAASAHEPSELDWSAGEVLTGAATPSALARTVAGITTTGADAPDAILHWSLALGRPDPALAIELLAQPDDVWHGGLRLGTAGLPHLIDHVAPTWMLNRDPDPAIEATSWRLDLRGCLVRTGVIDALGHIDPDFDTLLGAGLELGHRWINHGARMRHVPRLAPAGSAVSGGASAASELSGADGYRFVERCYGRKWMMWAALAEARRPATFRDARTAMRSTRPTPAAVRQDFVPPSLDEPADGVAPASAEGTVTVLIPTVERYPSLDVVLDQMRRQVVAPDQIVVVDQTPEPDRRTDLADRFADLPVEVVQLAQAGQCTARNTGLEHAKGDYVLFIDDDDEVTDDLISLHLRAIGRRRVEVSSGVVHEPNGPARSEEFQRFRVSDTFPTNNSLVRRDALDGSGWFDPAYDRGDRADHDLGMRLYLSGARMVMDPRIDVLHNHAPRGGLRVHNARTVTYGKARASIELRQSLSPTQIYLWQRYYSPQQVDRGIRLHLASGLFGVGPKWRRLARLAVQAASLPVARRDALAAKREAGRLAEAHTPIPHLTAATRP